MVESLHGVFDGIGTGIKFFLPHARIYSPSNEYKTDDHNYNLYLHVASSSELLDQSVCCCYVVVQCGSQMVLILHSSQPPLEESRC